MFKYTDIAKKPWIAPRTSEVKAKRGCQTNGKIGLPLEAL